MANMLAGMNWRRGILLAGIHLFVAGSVLVWNESRFWQYIRTDRNRPVLLPNPDPAMGQYANPCEGWIWDGAMPPNQTILAYADLPVGMITGGHEPCNTPTQLDRMVQTYYGKTHKSEVLTLIILCSAIAVQWFLLGAFPLIHPIRWWLEPGALITVCTPAVAVLAFIPESVVTQFTLPFLTLAGWIYWLGVVVWLLFRWLRRVVAVRFAHPAH